MSLSEIWNRLQEGKYPAKNWGTLDPTEKIEAISTVSRLIMDTAKEPVKNDAELKLRLKILEDIENTIGEELEVVGFLREKYLNELTTAFSEEELASYPKIAKAPLPTFSPKSRSIDEAVDSNNFVDVLYYLKQGQIPIKIDALCDKAIAEHHYELVLELFHKNLVKSPNWFTIIGNFPHSLVIGDH